MSKYFGTDGFRGYANKDLTVNHAFKIGRFLGWYYGSEKNAKIVIGKDTRISGDMYENALAAGITASGCDVYLLHVITTPGLAFVTRSGGFACGVMISASHNPYYDNGIKLINKDGEKMEENVIEAVEQYLDGTLEAPLAEGDALGRCVEFSRGVDRYEAYLEKTCPTRLDGIKIALDCANGSAAPIAPRVFKELGADIDQLSVWPHGTNINNNCGSTHIEALQAYVKEHHMDMGFAFDGDADRCLCVDENGELVDGDLVLYICAKFLKERGEWGDSHVVTTVMSNFGLYKALDAIGIGYEKTKVGDKYVYENMKKNGYLIGGEQSGHTIFLKYATTGDGIMTALQVMRVYVETEKKLSELKADVTIYPQVLKNVRVTDKDATLENAQVQKTCDEVSARLGDHGRILLRKSGTEPVLRVMAEAPTFEECEACVDEIIAAMDQVGMLIEVKK